MRNGKEWAPREKEPRPEVDGEPWSLLAPGKRTLTQGMMHSSVPMQAKRGGTPAEAAFTQVSGGSGSALPEGLRAQMESSMGTDFSHVRVHEGPRASSVGALAYTQGADIHFAPGQYNPSSQAGQSLIGHELVHVVQQAQGRVAPTTQAKGVAINDESALEREADEVGTKAARGESAQVGGVGADSNLQSVGVAAGLTQLAPIQRTPDPATCSTETGGLGDHSNANDAFGTFLAALQQARDDAQRQSANTALVGWCRHHLVDESRLQEFHGSALGADEKTRILGQLRVAIARNEFLLGWSYAGGVTRSGGWEHAGPNRGAYPDYCMNEVETVGRTGGSPWCTSFAGHTATRLGFEAAPGEGDTSMFWSGLRLDQWAREGTTISGARVTAPDQSVAAGGGGSVRIGGDKWAELYRRLEQARGAPEQVVGSFFSEVGHVPQAGDMLVLDANNAVVGSSHTKLVERYDAATCTIYTIGGNENDAVRGGQIQLTDRAQVRELGTMIRIGAAFYTGPGARRSPRSCEPDVPNRCSLPMTADQGAEIGEELLRTARTINQRIREVMVCLNQVGSGGDASTLELQD